MPNNNPSGVNSFEGLGTEEPYGQATQDAQLAAGAPLASGGLASGAIAAPKRDQRSASRQPAPEAAQGPLAEPPSQQPPTDPTVQVWQQVAATPGASDLVREYAATAAQAA